MIYQVVNEGGKNYLYFGLKNGDLILVDRDYHSQRFPGLLLLRSSVTG